MMNDTAEALPVERAIDIRFGQADLIQVRLHTLDTGAILDDLTGRVASAPQFFSRTGVCVDLSALKRSPLTNELQAVFSAIRRAGMIPVGLAQGAPAVEELARALDTAVLAQMAPQRKPAPVAKAVEPPPAAEPAGQPSLQQLQPVRSGQRVYARNRDLIVTAMVSAGGEVMADGCVHLYGPLRGRVMAGVRGDTHARVFCQDFDAQLVSIAGVFRVFETVPPELAGKPVQAWLEGEDLRFARVGA